MIVSCGYHLTPAPLLEERGEITNDCYILSLARTCSPCPARRAGIATLLRTYSTLAVL
ncbi:hypothetical protein [Paludibacter sp. 221]|uniref:hypothetical protein n=1 Tax=Paludibacter sp. 221 TaxID=2302939 RepID=UPI0013D8B9EE|nr:hypothetical protein [Paludibacter sp. 221]